MMNLSRVCSEINEFVTLLSQNRRVLSTIVLGELLSDSFQNLNLGSCDRRQEDLMMPKVTLNATLVIQPLKMVENELYFVVFSSRTPSV